MFILYKIIISFFSFRSYKQFRIIRRQEYDHARGLHEDCRTPQLPDDKLKKYYTAEKREQLKLEDLSAAEADIIFVKPPSTKRQQPSLPQTGKKTKLKKFSAESTSKKAEKTIKPNYGLPDVLCPKADIVVNSEPINLSSKVLDEAEFNRRLDEKMSQFMQKQKEEMSRSALVQPIVQSSTPLQASNSLVVSSNISGPRGYFADNPAGFPSYRPLTAGSGNFDLSSEIAIAISNDRLMHSFEMNALYRSNHIHTLLSMQNYQQQQYQAGNRF